MAIQREIEECRFKTTLDPINPSRIFVWDGNYLVRDFDFIIQNNELLILNTDAIINELVRENPAKALKLPEDSIAKEFDRLVRSNRNKYVILSFNIAQLGISNIGSISKVLSLNPYVVPASELKGFIRTAILNHILQRMSDSERQRVFNEVRSRLQRISRGPKDLKDVAQPVEMLVKAEINLVVGRRILSYLYDSLNRLRISDPDGYERVNRELTEVYVVESNGKLIGVNYVIAWSASSLAYDIAIQKPRQYLSHYSEVKRVDSEITCDVIKTALKEFGKYLVESEIEKVRRSKGAFDKYKLQGYLDYLIRLRDSNYCGDDCACARIGMFTGFRSKTVRVSEDVEKVRESVMTMVYGHNWNDNTLKLVRIIDGKGQEQYIGVGWARLCLK
ncbi:MAG: hypothetical protein ACP5NQ_04710 [Vulcanisaeta sp.]